MPVFKQRNPNGGRAMTAKKEEYLGDGVYVTSDGYHIILDLRAQGSDRIALEPEVFQRLLQFAKKHELMPEKARLRMGEGQ